MPRQESNFALRGRRLVDEDLYATTYTGVEGQQTAFSNGCEQCPRQESNLRTRLGSSEPFLGSRRKSLVCQARLAGARQLSRQCITQPARGLT
jgi:hypothetical protein